MKLEPVITEKTLKLAEKGKYTFKVDKNITKFQIKKLVNEIFSVHTQKVHTIKVPGELKKTIRGEKRIIKPAKKAIVTLKEKEKIDLFETKKKHDLKKHCTCICLTSIVQLQFQLYTLHLCGLAKLNAKMMNTSELRITNDHRPYRAKRLGYS